MVIVITLIMLLRVLATEDQDKLEDFSCTSITSQNKIKLKKNLGCFKDAPLDHSFLAVLVENVVCNCMVHTPNTISCSV